MQHAIGMQVAQASGHVKYGSSHHTRILPPRGILLNAPGQIACRLKRCDQPDLLLVIVNDPTNQWQTVAMGGQAGNRVELALLRMKVGSNWDLDAHLSTFETRTVHDPKLAPAHLGHIRQICGQQQLGASHSAKMQNIRRKGLVTHACTHYKYY
jgi:hypothetical protein